MLQLRHTVQSIPYALAVLAAICCSTVHAETAENDNFYPSYVSAGRVFMGTVSLSLFAEPAHINVCKMVLSDGKEQDSPGRRQELTNARKQLRNILQSDPTALDAYLALSQIDRDFRHQEYTRLSKLPSTSLRVEWVKKEWMDWCHVFDTRKVGEPLDQKRVALIINRMEKRWHEKNDLIVGVMLIEMGAYAGYSGSQKVSSEIIQSLAGKDVSKQYQQALETRFSSAPPSIESVPKANLRPLLGVVGYLYCRSSTQAIHPDLYTAKGAFVTKTPPRDDYQNKIMNYYQAWLEKIRGRVAKVS